MAKKPIFITLDESLHAQMKSTAPLLDMTLQAAYDEALRSWLARHSPGQDGSIDDESTSVIKSPNIDIRESETRWVRLLIAILRCKYQQIATAIQHNLEAFAMILGAESERGSGGAGLPPGSGPATAAALRETREAERGANEVIESATSSGKRRKDRA